VLKTAVDTFEHGLTPWLIADACASNGGDRMHKTGLRLARRFIGSKHIINASDLEPYLS
jgi:nicotinamidase-related amidase